MAAVRSELPTLVLLISRTTIGDRLPVPKQGAAGSGSRIWTRTEIVKAVLDCAKGRDVVAPSLGARWEIRQRAAPVAPVLARERGAQSHCVRSKHPRDRRAICMPSTVKTHVTAAEKPGCDRAAAVAEAQAEAADSASRGATACTGPSVVCGQRTS